MTFGYYQALEGWYSAGSVGINWNKKEVKQYWF